VHPKTKAGIQYNYSLLAHSGVQRSGDARGDCLIGRPLPNSSIEQWCMVVIKGAARGGAEGAQAPPLAIRILMFIY